VHDRGFPFGSAFYLKGIIRVNMAETEKSVTWVVVMVMLFIAAFGWAFMAAGYAHSEEGWRGGGVEAARGPMGPRRAGRAGPHYGIFLATPFNKFPIVHPSLASLSRIARGCQLSAEYSKFLQFLGVTK
jgi:hypothetical protein